ncbi:LysR substrate-binding domain-containing protein [Aquabacterium sp.]|uniref:LysR substrate-binding domain-containing protein n=1 Tax=Aquabacterium sp. TaxID=1872578 RepID=UPI002B66F4BF|nr:LysR substrate-binding domain-containing protein [Aquabacterium sp.]HSW07382.1 LysR substrate-binding domain-containing protein [Aquabacterium sp.]
MSRHFDPLTLRLFVAICEEGNIARAAEREALVPSALSKRIAAIEAAVGTPLLQRGRRGVSPTAAGEALLRQARELLGAMDRLQAELSEFSAGAQGSVRVMASVSVLAEQLPDDLASFLAQHHAVRVSVDERLSHEILRSLREGSADIGVLWDNTDFHGLQTHRYRSDHLCVALPPGHALARRRRLRFADTLAYPAVGVAPGGLMDTLLRRQAALAGQAQAHRIQVSSLDAACRIVAAGLGLAVLPREATAPHAAARGLVMLPLSDDWAERRFVICTRPEPLLSATTRLLVTHLVKQAGS